MNLSLKEFFNFIVQNKHIFSPLDEKIESYFNSAGEEVIGCAPCGAQIKAKTDSYVKFVELLKDESVFKKILDTSESILYDKLILKDLGVISNQNENPQNK